MFPLPFPLPFLLPFLLYCSSVLVVGKTSQGQQILPVPLPLIYLWRTRFVSAARWDKVLTSSC